MPVISKKKNSPQNRVTRLTDEQRDMVEQHIKLAYHMASVNRHRWLSLDRDEMISECMYGLMKAARNYDESLGYKFSTFACACMFRHTSAIHKRTLDSNKILLRRNNLQYDCDFDWKEGKNEHDVIDSEDSVSKILALIPDDERSVVSRHALSGENFIAIAKSIKMNRESVREKYHRAINNIRQRIKEKTTLEVGK